MKLCDEEVRRFIANWKVAFGEEIDFDTAYIKFQELVTLYRELARPLPEEQDGPSNPSASNDDAPSSDSTGETRP